LALVHALYKRDVEDRISVSEKELREAYRHSKTRLHVQHIFSSDYESIQEYSKRLQNGDSFETVAEDAFRDVDPAIGGSDLGEISWGDLDSKLEGTAFTLPLMQHSKPVQSQWGYHILQVSHRTEELILTENDYVMAKESLKLRIKKRHAEKASREYLKALLDPQEIRVKQHAFQVIVRELNLQTDSAPRGLLGVATDHITDDILNQIRNNLSYELNEPFMVSRSDVWSLSDFLNKLSELPVHRRPMRTNRQVLYEKVGIIIRNHFLSIEAEKRNLVSSPCADSSFKAQAGKIFYWHYLEKTGRSKPIPGNVKKYYHNKENPKSQTFPIPESVLPGMGRLQDWAVYYARKALHDQLLEMNPDIDIQIDTLSVIREADRIDWDHPIRMMVTQTP